MTKKKKSTNAAREVQTSFEFGSQVVPFMLPLLAHRDGGQTENPVREAQLRAWFEAHQLPLVFRHAPTAPVRGGRGRP